MFSTSCSFNPFLYATNRTTMASSFTNTQNPCSMPVPEDHSSPFLQFSTVPLADVDDDLLISEFLSSHQQQQQQQQILGSNSNPKSPLATDQQMNPAASKEGTRMENKKKRSNVSATKQTIPRRRTGKKDRHSKICTAQGPRDRRMRLSLQIARKFFDLQDMLGFDKASKTIEWLFTKSKAAIKELSDNFPGEVKRSLSSAGEEKSISSTSESEVVSDSSKKLTPKTSSAGKRMIAEGADSHLSIPRKEKCQKIHSRTVLKFFDKESRDKARERARERTRRKLKTKGLEQSKQCSSESPSNLKKLEHFCLLENAEKLGPGNEEMNSVLGMVREDNNVPVSIIDKFLEIKEAARTSSVLDFSHNYAVPSGTNLDDAEILGFPSNWDLNNAKMQYRYSAAMPSMKLPTGNPNESFMTTPNAQEQSLTSILMTTKSSRSQEGYYYGSSAFMNIPDSNGQNPNCVLMNSNSGLVIGNKYDSLFGNA